MLGTGGLNANTLPHLCGLGVGRLTLLDRDRVEPRNFARQYLYRWSDIGERKVGRAAAWVESYDPANDVAAINAEVSSVDDITSLIERHEPSVVMSGIDSPDEIDDWVNAACVSAGVPYVRGGMWVTQGVVWSVDPGRSACRACATAQTIALTQIDPAAAERAVVALYGTKARANRGIGPVAGLVGSFAAFEVLRYLTRFEPPAYAGRPLTIDFAGGCATQQTTWQRDPHCAVCGKANSASAPTAEAALLGDERR